jgi:CheY-like chemotaxis protein
VEEVRGGIAQMTFETPVVPYSILIVEELPVLCCSISEIFRNGPYRVVMTANGNDAFAKANSQHFDLVITSIGMPGKDGIELLNTLRKQKPDPLVIVIGREVEIDTVY